MDKKEIVIKIGGEAGFGIKAAGLILSKTLFGLGYGIFGYSEYPSLIRGGHNTYQINISKDNVFSATKNIDILIALNQESIDLHKDELNKGGVIIYDNLDLNDEDFSKINLIQVPLGDLAKKAGGEVVRNVISLAAVLSLLGIDLKYFDEEIKEFFSKKGKEVINMNNKAAKLGYDYVKNNYEEQVKKQEFGRSNLDKKDNDYFFTANEATALGMIQAGCKFYSAYPMTPATSILHVLAQKQRRFDLVVHQAEDEISAIGTAIGASTAGLRSATGTSGGGFALMTENVGLAGMTETPLVIIESQRTSPASGMPTWTEQGDLKFIINVSHGEFPRFVMAPGDAEEAFYMIGEAFNLAEKWQVPVLFVLDKLLSESDYNIRDLNIDKITIRREGLVSNEELQKMKDYKRYEITSTGISKRALPGQEGGVHVINSDEHDEYGYSTEESEMRTKMMDKRFSKVKGMINDIAEPILYGKEKADLTIVGWGSVKGAVFDAMKECGDNVNFLHIAYIWPFPKEKVKSVLQKADKILLIENNKTGQLGDLIQEQTGIEIKNRFLKYDGRPFFREEVVDEINKIFEA